MLYDMHCHLDFAKNAPLLARDAQQSGIGAFSTTVTPEDYTALRESLAQFPHVRVGLGLHPWWIADGRCSEQSVALFEALAPNTPFIGEIGLDFARIRGENACRELQLFYLERMLRACNSSHKVISLHAVRATHEILDTLEQTGTIEQHTCIFHWFSGTSEELQRAITAGCYFSVGPRMLATKRGRAYAQAIPLDRLLLETDEPTKIDTPFSAEKWKSQLNNTVAELGTLRNIKVETLAEQLTQTSTHLLRI